jgi:hypothetical protein
MMGKLPAFQFYPGDWRKDPAVQSLDYSDRGIWLEMLCLMHESEQRGFLLLNGKPMSTEVLARVLGIDPLRAKSTVETLLLHGVASRDERGVIFNRRMARDEEKRDFCTEQGKRGGNPKLVANYNAPGFVYAMRRPSDGKIKIGISLDPTKRLYKVRYATQETIELLATKPVQDMGREEAILHSRFSHVKKDGEWFALSESETVALVSTLKGEAKANPTPSARKMKMKTEDEEHVFSTGEDFEGTELSVANGILMNLSIPGGERLLQLVAQALAFEGKRLGSAQKAIDSLEQAMKSVKGTGVKWFLWFQDQGYLPQKPQNRKATEGMRFD